MNEDGGNACARCIPGSCHGNGSAELSARTTPHTARSCDYVVDVPAQIATSDGNKLPSLTHATTDVTSLGINRDIDSYPCGSSPKSELSSEFDEYFESTQHHSHVILEETTPREQCVPVVQSFVGSLVTRSFHDGCQAAVGMLPRMETFCSTQPNNLVKPKAIRTSGLDRGFKVERGKGRHGNLIDLNSCERVENAVEPLANNCRANEASASDIAQFASDLLMNTFSSAVLNVRSHLETRNGQYARLAGNMVDESINDAVTMHQQRRRTVSEGLVSVGGRGDGHRDSGTFYDTALPSFFEECLSDEMKVKLMEMVASQHARVDTQRNSGTGDARRTSASEAAQAGYDRWNVASSDRGSQRASAMRPSMDRDGGTSVNLNRQATGHWNVPTIRIYSNSTDSTEIVQSGARDDTLSAGPLSNDGHSQRCSCPHCVCSVDGYVDLMIDDVMTDSYDAIMENQCDEAKERLARFTFHSPDGAVESDLQRFAGRLVHLAMRDAMRLLRRANKHVKRCRHRSQGRASSPQPVERADPAVFSRSKKRLSLQNGSLVPSSAPSTVDARRCSLDETRSLQLSTDHCSSFRDVVLSDFEDELRNSSVRSPNLHLFESDDTGSFLRCSQRRASEPIHSMKRGLIAESATRCLVRSVACDRSVATSTEVVIGWLNSSDWGGRAHQEVRTTDRPSHLNDYVDRLITNIFDSTYSELFDRDPHILQEKARESKPVCDTQLFTRLWHGPRAAHCSPPGGVGSNSDTKLLMSNYFPTPAPFHSLNVMAAVMAGHIVRDAVRAVSAQHHREEVRV